MGGIDFGGFEGLFGAAVGEGPGDGFAVFCHLLAGGVGEDVEDFAGDEEGLFLAGEEGGDFGVGEVGGDFHRNITRHAGETGEFFKFGGAGAALAQGAEEQLGDIDGMTCADVAGAGGMQLSDPA